MFLGLALKPHHFQYMVTLNHSKCAGLNNFSAINYHIDICDWIYENRSYRPRQEV